MKVLILSFGTKGDIEPYIAMAQALDAAGHEAVLGTAEGFADDVRGLGVEFVAVNSRMLELVQHALPTMSGPKDLMRTLRAMTESMREGLDDQVRAVRHTRPDLIVYHPKTLGAPHLAEYLDVPAVLSIPLPFYTKTAAYPIPFVPRSLGTRLNRLSYEFGRASSLLYGGMIYDLRRKLGLSPLSRWADPLRNPDGTPIDVIYPYSRHVVPVPGDYPPTAHVTGYLFTDRGTDWEPPPELADFLAAGDPPVYIGFGSMGFGQGARERGEAITSALASTGIRAVVATGWGGVSITGGENVLVIEGAPHDWLFPRVSAVVHHGGAGTTGIGLASARPSLICPFVGDQPFWGERVHALGAGPRPLPRAQFTAGSLARRIEDLVGTERYRTNAAEIAEGVASEDGAAAAVDTVEQIYARFGAHRAR